MHCQVQVLHAGGQIRKKHHPFLSPHRGYLKVMAIMSFVDAFWILLYFPLIVAFPRIWRKTARRQHVASPLYQLADVLHSMGSGGTSFGNVWNWRENFGHKTHNSDFGLRRRHAQMPHKLRFHLCFFFFCSLVKATCAASNLLRQMHSFQSTIRTQTADVLFTRPTLFIVCGVGVYKWVSLPISLQAPVLTTY